MHLALREVQASYTSPRVLGAMAAVAVILGLAGPFGSFSELGFGPRLGYWTAIVFLTYGAGLFAAVVLEELVRDRLTNRATIIGLMGLGASVPALIVVTLVNMVFLSTPHFDPTSLMTLWVYCLVIGIGVSLIHSLVMAGHQIASAPATGIPVAPEVARARAKLLDRLPVGQRGRLTRLSMQDHYVEVVTDRGKELLLMRLSDAIAETDGVAGLQIHRSHWVAIEAIKRVERRRGKVVVEMIDGTVLPLSRTYLAQAKAVGILV